MGGSAVSSPMDRDEERGASLSLTAMARAVRAGGCQWQVGGSRIMMGSAGRGGDEERTHARAYVGCGFMVSGCRMTVVPLPSRRVWVGGLGNQEGDKMGDGSRTGRSGLACVVTCLQSRAGEIEARSGPIIVIAGFASA